MKKNIAIISSLLLLSATSAYAQGIPSDTSNDLEKGSANPIANNTPINTNDAIENDTPKMNAQLPVSTDEKTGTAPVTTKVQQRHRKKHVDNNPDSPNNTTDMNSLGAPAQ